LGEITQAQAVMPHLTTAAARDFANMMITDHTQALRMAQNVFGSNRIQIRETNPTAVSLKSRSGALVKQLSAITTADRAYIQAQVQLHQDVLQIFDTQLIPSANAVMERFLRQRHAAEVGVREVNAAQRRPRSLQRATREQARPRPDHGVPPAHDVEPSDERAHVAMRASKIREHDLGPLVVAGG